VAEGSRIMIPGVTCSQDLVEVKPDKSRTRGDWNVYLNDEFVESKLRKRDAVEYGKELATEENAMFRSYRIEGGVPVGLSTSEEIDFAK